MSTKPTTYQAGANGPGSAGLTARALKSCLPRRLPRLRLSPSSLLTPGSAHPQSVGTGRSSRPQLRHQRILRLRRQPHARLSLETSVHRSSPRRSAVAPATHVHCGPTAALSAGGETTLDRRPHLLMSDSHQSVLVQAIRALCSLTGPLFAGD